MGVLFVASMRSNIANLFNRSRESVNGEERDLRIEAARIRKGISFTQSPSQSQVLDENTSPGLGSLTTKDRYTIDATEYQKLWASHESAWIGFSELPPHNISYSSIPFPPCDTDILEFTERLNKLECDPKSAYIIACKRYHPDKFFQRFGASLVECDIPRITGRLNSITQCITTKWKQRRCASLPRQ